MLTCLAAVETIKSDNPVNIASIQNPKVYKIMAPSHPRHRTLADASVPRILECLSLEYSSNTSNTGASAPRILFLGYFFVDVVAKISDCTSGYWKPELE